MRFDKRRYTLDFFLVHAARWLLTGSLLVLLGIGAYISIRFYHVDNQLYLWWTSERASQTTVVPLNGKPRPQYRMEIDSRVIADIDRNLSGLAFNTDRNQLIAVINRPPTLLTLNLEGRILQRHRLRHSSDVEGVAYMGGNHVALVEEGRGRIVIVPLPKSGNADLDLQNTSSLTLNMTSTGVAGDNAGFEGLGYDHAHDQLYLAKEHSPRALYRVGGVGEYLNSGRLVISVENLDHWLAAKGIGTDLSSVEFNATNGHLLLLSDESQRIVELDRKGAIINQVELRTMQGSNHGVPQGEGLALGPDGTLYMVSEPNLFYRLRPKDAMPQP